MRPKYAIVTPARDEAKHITRTLESVVGQTVHPEKWVVVDDGSSDNTREIVRSFAARHGWIVLVQRADRGSRKSGGGVVEAFYEGLKELNGTPWDFIVKLDADLSFSSNYFQSCLSKFGADPKLGIGGGALLNVTESGDRAEPHPDFHVRGATKIYRRACWEQINGLWTGPGWDTIDEVHANMLGWRTCTFRDVSALHHRVTGAADGGWRDNIKNGRGCYVSGYHPLYVLARCVNLLNRKPYVTGAVGMMYGFIAAHWQQLPHIDNPDLIRYIRRQQINRLVGKPTIWK